MLYDCYHTHTKHISTLCGQNVDLLKIKLLLHVLNNGV
jgi:hypothetical protein